MPKKNSGQALLLVLLAVASILVVAMSVVSQSISDIRVSTQEEESIRALNAAEAGLEEVLKGDVATGTLVNSNVQIAQKESTYDAVVEDYGTSTDFQYPKQLNSGETATIWFKDHDSDGNFTGGGGFAPTSIRFCWGNPFTIGNFNSPTAAALEVKFFYLDGPNLETKTFAYDPYNNRANNRHWMGVTKKLKSGLTECDFGGFKNTTSRDIPDILANTGISPSSLQFAVVRMFYNVEPQYVGVKVLSGETLPSQGRKVDSTGNSGVSTRRVELNLLYSDAPSPFVAAIVSRKGIGKQ